MKEGIGSYNILKDGTLSAQARAVHSGNGVYFTSTIPASFRRQAHELRLNSLPIPFSSNSLTQGVSSPKCIS
jgi:hypothetical protein